MEETQAVKATRFLLEMLDKGDKPSALIMEEAKLRGISYPVLRRVKVDLKISHYKQGKVMYWRTTDGLLAKEKNKQTLFKLYKLFMGFK